VEKGGVMNEKEEATMATQVKTEFKILRGEISSLGGLAKEVEGRLGEVLREEPSIPAQQEAEPTRPRKVDFAEAINQERVNLETVTDRFRSILNRLEL
jgi:hypothetical protein